MTGTNVLTSAELGSEDALIPTERLPAHKLTHQNLTDRKAPPRS